MKITLVSYDADARSATIRVGESEKTIIGLGDMGKKDLVAYLTSVAEQEFKAPEPLAVDLSEYVGKSLPNAEDIEDGGI